MPKNVQPDDVIVVHHTLRNRSICYLNNGEMLGVPKDAIQRLSPRSLGFLLKILTWDETMVRRYLEENSKHQLESLKEMMVDLSREGYVFMKMIHGNYHFVVRETPITQAEATEIFDGIRKGISSNAKKGGVK